MALKNLYQVLQVDSAASQEVIEAAYRRLAKKYHPDISTDPNAMRLMQEINEAFRVLRDPEERERYDYILSNARTAQTSQPGHEQSNHGTQASSARSEPKQQRNQTYTSPGIPVYCQKCGISDGSLRLAVFPYVISIVLVTFRRAWSGIFCSHCSSQKMTIAKLLSFTFGWWGIPFGAVYTLGVLFKPSQGVVPPEANGPYLRALAAHFLEIGRVADAEQALAASLAYQYDQEVASVYQQTFGRDPKKYIRTNGGGSGALFGMAALAALAVLVVIFFAAISPANGPTVTPPPIVPTRAATSTPAKAPETTSEATIPEGWMPYHSEQGHFSALIPFDYIPKEQPLTSDGRASAVFVPTATQSDSNYIYVEAIPLPQMGEAQLPSTDELTQFASDWIEKNGFTVVLPPTTVEHDGGNAVKMVYEAPSSDGNYQDKVYAAVIVAPGWQYYLEVGAHAASSSGAPSTSNIVQITLSLRRYFDIFFESFVSSK
jgi:hypothetical protein